MTATGRPSGGTGQPGKRRGEKSAHFFQREADGSVRVRLKFTEEEADKIENAAGTTPLMTYLHRCITSKADYHLQVREEEAAAERNGGNGNGTKGPNGSGVESA